MGRGVTGIPCFAATGHHAGSHLFHDTGKPRVYLTADYWLSRKSYEEFLSAQDDEYRALDSVAEELTANERRIGSYETGSYEAFAPSAAASPE
jgi:hypothetical protein